MESHQRNREDKGSGVALNRTAELESWRGKLSKQVLPFWLLIVFIFSFQLFDNFPFVRTAHLAEIPVFLFLSVFAVFYYGRAVYEKRSFSPTEILLACLLCLPLVSAVSAWVSFDQPILAGFLTERRWVRAVAGFFVFQLLFSYQISWKTLHRLFLLLAFGSLLIYLSIWFFLKPDSLAGGFFFVNVPSKGMRLRITPVFVIWGAIYYALGWIRSNSTIPRLTNSVFAVLMVGYVVFIYKSRAAIIVLAVVLAWMAVLKAERGRKVRTLIAPSLLVMFVIGAIWVARPQVLRRQLSGFTVIATSVCAGDGELDASLANRLSQGTVAWWSVSRSARTLLFGNGRLSRRWGGEPSQSFGHFYPMDIGWLGIVFLYGIFGFVLVNLSFLMAWKFSRKDMVGNKDVFLNSLKWWMVYLFFRSILNGISVASPALVMVPLFLIYWRCCQSNSDSPLVKEIES